MKYKGPWEALRLEDHLHKVMAIKALARGEADANQQRVALQFIIEEVCKTYDMSYHPGSDRDTTFAEGKRHVGNTLILTMKINTEYLRKLNRLKKPEEKDNVSHKE